MRHRKSFNHLGRKTAHRSAMLANMASSLILHKRIETTIAKAKALRGYVEPLITKSKEDTTHSRRTVFSYLQNKEAVTELFREVGAKVADRPGGYLRLLKIGSRLGDNAEMCIVELVDYNEILLSETTDAKAKTGRRRRGSKKKSDSAPQAPAIAPTGKVEEVITDEVEEVITDEVEETVTDQTAEVKSAETAEVPEGDSETEKPEVNATVDTSETEPKAEAKTEEEPVSEAPVKEEKPTDPENTPDETDEEKK